MRPIQLQSFSNKSCLVLFVLNIVGDLQCNNVVLRMLKKVNQLVDQLYKVNHATRVNNLTSSCPLSAARCRGVFPSLS